MISLITKECAVRESTIDKRCKFPDGRYYSMTKGDLIKLCADLGIGITSLKGETKELIIMRIREIKG